MLREPPQRHEALVDVWGGMQTYTKMEAKKAEMMKQMSQTVFDISMDSQEGAIYSVLDEMADQYVKEILLAYFLLLKYKYPCTEARPLPCLQSVHAQQQGTIFPLGIQDHQTLAAIAHDVGRGVRGRHRPASSALGHRRGLLGLLLTDEQINTQPVRLVLWCRVAV